MTKHKVNLLFSLFWPFTPNLGASHVQHLSVRALQSYPSLAPPHPFPPSPIWLLPSPLGPAPRYSRWLTFHSRGSWRQSLERITMWRLRIFKRIFASILGLGSAPFILFKMADICHVIAMGSLCFEGYDAAAQHFLHHFVCIDLTITRKKSNSQGLEDQVVFYIFSELKLQTNSESYCIALPEHLQCNG